MKETIQNANFPRDAEGHVYHLHVKTGQVANRILTVGDHVRARAIAQHLDQVYFEHSSQRGFLTITGSYQGTPVSIMAIGMGNPMMDFFVRETRAVVEGDIAIIRFGSCGSLTQKAGPGAVIVPQGGYCIRRNIDYFCDEPMQKNIEQQAYLISGNFAADKVMTEQLATSVSKVLAPHQLGPVLTGGLNADGCSFYSSQGRLDPQFWDDNEQVITEALALHPDTQSLEMETSMLFHLAHCSKGTIRAAGCMQVFADRVNNGFISPEMVAKLEPLVGQAVLDTLVQVKLENEMQGPNTVWA
ncbi:purine and uridine phosphorylase [Hesseltinella vesiculosa]|uniref:Purine and uridine phosphorylase n=1 Tax=Hesseltinella vesiculosa TaxID=101127 RepID=A0A1X2G424_9FUNG|nr:purine and uridine phosphorylase [Hesseltinella vesiculosa]